MAKIATLSRWLQMSLARRLPDRSIVGQAPIYIAPVAPAPVIYFVHWQRINHAGELFVQNFFNPAEALAFQQIQEYHCGHTAWLRPLVTRSKITLAQILVELAKDNL